MKVLFVFLNGVQLKETWTIFRDFGEWMKYVGLSVFNYLLIGIIPSLRDVTSKRRRIAVWREAEKSIQQNLLLYDLIFLYMSHVRQSFRRLDNDWPLWGNKSRQFCISDCAKLATVVSTKFTIF
jgi:hypothetical protein